MLPSRFIGSQLENRGRLLPDPLASPHAARASTRAWRRGPRALHRRSPPLRGGRRSQGSFEMTIWASIRWTPCAWLEGGQPVVDRRADSSSQKRIAFAPYHPSARRPLPARPARRRCVTTQRTARPSLSSSWSALTDTERAVPRALPSRLKSPWVFPSETARRPSTRRTSSTPSSCQRSGACGSPTSLA